MKWSQIKISHIQDKLQILIFFLPLITLKEMEGITQGTYPMMINLTLITYLLLAVLKEEIDQCGKYQNIPSTHILI